MKKYALILLTLVAVTTFGFISYDSSFQSSNGERNENDQIVIKGLEKSGYSESNTASL